MQKMQSWLNFATNIENSNTFSIHIIHFEQYIHLIDKNY